MRKYLKVTAIENKLGLFYSHSSVADQVSWYQFRQKNLSFIIVMAGVDGSSLQVNLQAKSVG